MFQLHLDLDYPRSAPEWSEAVNEIEISYRPQCPTSLRAIHTPEDAVAYLCPFTKFRGDQEKFWAIPLDTRCRPKGVFLVTLGTLTSTLATPRETYRVAIATSAARLIVAHNHPSGDPAPSSADMAITRKLREAGEAIDINLQDHIVLGLPSMDPLGLGYFSFRKAGYI